MRKRRLKRWHDFPKTTLVGASDVPGQLNTCTSLHKGPRVSSQLSRKILILKPAIMSLDHVARDASHRHPLQTFSSRIMYFGILRWFTLDRCVFTASFLGNKNADASRLGLSILARQSGWILRKPRSHDIILSFQGSGLKRQVALDLSNLIAGYCRKCVFLTCETLQNTF